MLQIKPVHKKQQENFDKVLKCITHLLHLLLSTSKTPEQTVACFKAAYTLVKYDLRSACTSDTLMHLSVSRLNIIRSGYFTDDTTLRVIYEIVSELI